MDEIDISPISVEDLRDDASGRMITEMSDLAYHAFGETYRGEILHHGTAYPGQHKSIIDPEFWEIVQDKLAANRRRNCCFFPLPEPSGDVSLKLPLQRL